jgi:Family of unknown function (DUF5684)
MIENLKATILAVGIGIVIIAVLAYLAYMIGLVLVLKRLKRLSWQAYIPLINYYAQIRAINAPSKWFLISLTPYVGAVYAAAVAIRLGRVFGRSTAWSLTWLVFGAPVGMFIIALGKTPPDTGLLSEPAELVDLKKIKQDRARRKKAKPLG